MEATQSLALLHLPVAAVVVVLTLVVEQMKMALLAAQAAALVLEALHLILVEQEIRPQ
jgi:hypothetical protein